MSDQSKLYACLLAGVAAGAITQAAQAQAQPAQTEAAGQGAGIEEVTVTARRRAESLQDVPIAVTALNEQQLRELGAPDLTYLSQISPNTTLEVSRGTNATLTAFIRGVGQQDPVAGFEAGVGIYIDDVYLNRPQGTVLDIYDVERIEILRGPQGTLYGRNTIGGAVKYVSKRLGDEPSLALDFAGGTFGQFEATAKVEAPVSDTVRVGATAAWLRRDGFGENLTTGRDQYDKDVLAFRASIEATPTERLFIRLSGDYLEDTSNPKAGFRLTPGLVSGAPVLDDVFDTRAGIEGRNVAEQYGGALLVEFEVNENWTIKNITAYREDENFQQIDFDSLAVQDVDVPVFYSNDQFSEELQILYTDDVVSGLVGFYYLDANAFNEFDVILAETGALIGLPGLNAFTLGDVDTSTWSIFGDFTVDLDSLFGTESGLELSIGGRYTEDERQARILRQTFIGGNTERFGGTDAVLIATTSDFRGEETFDDFTPRISLSWQPNDDITTYLSYSQGFKGGGFDPRGATTAAPDFNGDGSVDEDEVFEFLLFEPEQIDTYEWGLKSRLADGRLITNIAVFYSDYTDVQVPGSVGLDTDGDGVQETFAGITTNAGAATIWGVELDGKAVLATDVSGADDQLLLDYSVGWIDTEFDEFIAAVTDPVSGSTALEDVSDQRVFQNTPRWSVNTRLSYTRPVSLGGRDGDFVAIGSWSYKSLTRQFETPSPFLDQEGYSLFDASLVWTSADGVLRFGLHGKNLTDEEYIVAGYQFLTNDGLVSTLGQEGIATAFFGPPRTVTATVGITF